MELGTAIGKHTFVPNKYFM